jgi:hypothetical protein
LHLPVAISLDDKGGVMEELPPRAAFPIVADHTGDFAACLAVVFERR